MGEALLNSALLNTASAFEAQRFLFPAGGIVVVVFGIAHIAFSPAPLHPLYRRRQP